MQFKNKFQRNKRNVRKVEVLPLFQLKTDIRHLECPKEHFPL